MNSGILKDGVANKVIIKLGYSCNNNCVICHAAPKRQLPDSSTSDALRKVLLAKDMGSREIHFSGGEPTIRKDIMEIVRFTKENNMVPGIATNGRMFSYREFAERMRMSGLDYAYVSLHGTEKVHDEITRVTGSFHQTMKGIENLLEQRIQVRINLVVTRLNADCLPDFIGLLRGKEVELEFSFVDSKCPVYDRSIVPMMGEAAPKIMEALAQAGANGIRAFVRDIPYCMVPGLRDRVTSFPLCGITHMSESYEDRFFPVDHGTKTMPGKCKACSMKDSCEGVHARYIKLYGDSEFVPVR